MTVELGISTFGETTPLEKTGKPISHAERIRDLVEEAELADQVGLDAYAIGEHHREDIPVSAPEIILAAAAEKTKNIRLSSAVTILSSEDPVRVYEQYATIDALSNGRAEIMAGRGSFTESFPLFGYDLKDYDELFDEKLKMLLEISKHTNLKWDGKFTQNVDNRPVYPRFVQKDFPISVATGGNPMSTIKIAELGLPIVYAIIGGNPLSFKSLTTLYKQVAEQTNQDMSKMTISSHSWGWLDHDKEKAERDYFYPTKTFVDNISKDRPNWQPMSYEAYKEQIGNEGAIFVGDAETVAKKMIKVITELDLHRFYLHVPVGSMPHEGVMNTIRIFGEEVAPIVRDHFNKQENK